MTKRKSRVVVARLRRNEAEESQALKIYENYEAEGHNAREIITAALLKLDDLPLPHENMARTIADLRNTIDKLSAVCHPGQGTRAVFNHAIQ